MPAEGCGVGIVGLGAQLPAQVRVNDFWGPEFAASQAGELDFTGAAAQLAGRAAGDLVSRHDADPFRGAVERRVADTSAESSDLEISACRDAISVSGVDSDRIDLLIGYSQVPDDAGPGNHGRVARALGLPLQTSALTLEAGCASFLPQLTTAIRSVQVGDARFGLIYQSSLTSRVVDYRVPWSPSVGDGAVAQVVGPVADGLGLVARVQWTRGDLCDGLVLARADGKKRWTEAGRVAAPLVITSHDPKAAMRMGGDGAVFAHEACSHVLERSGYTPADVDFFVCAQATAWFGEACAAAVGIGPDRIVPISDHFQRYAHLLAASAPLNLWVAWKSGRLRVGDLVLMYSPGVGFTQAATLIRWSMRPPTS